MPSGLYGYELLVSEDGGEYQRVAQVADGEATGASFTVSGSCMSLNAYVKAIAADGVHYALSNRQSYTFSTSERPSRFFLRKVSVSDDGSVVTVVGQTDPAYNGDYKVYRRVDGGQAAVVGNCMADADGLLLWSDMSARPSESVYSYSFGVADGCGRNELKTRWGSTLLPVLRQDGNYVVVSWNGYEGWEGSTSYSLLSSPLGEDNWRTVAGGPGTEQSDDGDVSGEQLKYKVLAFEGGDSRYRLYDSLQSVEVFHKPHTDIWMPTAFTPQENSNNVVRPKASYINPDGYSFTVFNRAGLVVFTTSDPKEGWDGKSRGVMQPQGAYVYRIFYRQNDNTDQVLVGTVLLIY